MCVFVHNSTLAYYYDYDLFIVNEFMVCSLGDPINETRGELVDCHPSIQILPSFSDSAPNVADLLLYRLLN